jgi:hypothetical protein
MILDIVLDIVPEDAELDRTSALDDDSVGDEIEEEMYVEGVVTTAELRLTEVLETREEHDVEWED